MASILLEVCVDDSAGLATAIACGADRIELCSALELVGLSPTPGLIQAARSSPIPVFALIRPRSGDFCYDAPSVLSMRRDIEAVRAAGLAGVVLGASGLDHRLDTETLTILLEQSQGLQTTLHRAFDLVPDPFEALELAVKLGFHRILTSGGAASAWSGAASLRALVTAASGRIEILAGSGIRPGMAFEIVSRTGVRELHASCSSPASGSDPRLAALGFGAARRKTDLLVVQALRRELDGQDPSPL